MSNEKYFIKTLAKNRAIKRNSEQETHNNINAYNKQTKKVVNEFTPNIKKKIL